MTPLYLDIESYCEVPITDGTHRYAESAEVIMWQYAVGDGPVQVEDDLTPELIDLIEDSEYEIVIHNSQFDRNVIRHATGIAIPTERIFDTMVCAMAHSLPGGLGDLCDILGVATDKSKDKEGRTWIQLFCKPQSKGRKYRRCTKHTHPIEWRRFRNYGGLDVEAMREVYKKLPRWNFKDAERALWCLDQRINDRGVCVDVELADAAIVACAQAKEENDQEAVRRTEGAVTSTNQRDRMLEHILESYGVVLPDLSKATLERRVNDPDLPDPLRELLALRLVSSKTSVSKYKRVKNGVSRDGRLRGLLQMNGAARTGRWSGRLYQPQNQPRPTMEQWEIDRGIEELKAGAWGLI